MNPYKRKVIRIKKLTKEYKNLRAVDQMMIEINSGDIVGLIGPNGAGKTTTLSMLSGLVKPSSGDAYIFENSITQTPDEALSKVGIMLDKPCFYPNLSGYDNLRVFSRLFRLPDEQKISEVMDFVDLKRSDIRKPFMKYSKGMKKRLHFASVMLRDPEILILDEPTEGLDPVGIDWFHQVVDELSKSGKTILFSSHQLHDVEKLCNRIVLINKGKIILDDYSNQVLSNLSSVRIVFNQPEKAFQVLSDFPEKIEFYQEKDEFIFNMSLEKIETLLHGLSLQKVFPLSIQSLENLEMLFRKLINEKEEKNDQGNI